MSIDEMGTLFEKVDISREWSPWRWSHNKYGDFSYRTNGKSVQVEIWCGARGRASCHPDDEFNLEAGIALAMTRAVEKHAKRMRRDMEKDYGVLFSA